MVEKKRTVFGNEKVDRYWHDRRNVSFRHRTWRERATLYTLMPWVKCQASILFLLRTVREPLCIWVYVGILIQVIGPTQPTYLNHLLLYGAIPRSQEIVKADNLCTPCIEILCAPIMPSPQPSPSPTLSGSPFTQLLSSPP
jgi:hypothetical protein